MRLWVRTLYLLAAAGLGVVTLLVAAAAGSRIVAQPELTAAGAPPPGVIPQPIVTRFDPGATLIRLGEVAADGATPPTVPSPCDPTKFTFSPFASSLDGPAVLFSAYLFNPCPATFRDVSLRSDVVAGGRELGFMQSTIPRVGPGATPFTFIAPAGVSAQPYTLWEARTPVPTTWEELLEQATQLTLTYNGGEIFAFPEPSPAPDQGLSDPTLRVSCKLRGGLTWSDGQQMNAGDALFATSLGQAIGTVPNLFDQYPCPGGTVDLDLTYDDVFRVADTPGVVFNPLIPTASGAFPVYGTFSNFTRDDITLTGMVARILDASGAVVGTRPYTFSEPLASGQTHDFVTRPVLEPGQHLGEATLSFTKTPGLFLDGGPVTVFWPEEGDPAFAVLMFLLTNPYPFPIGATQAGAGFTNTGPAGDPIVDYGSFGALQNFVLPVGGKTILSVPYDPIAAAKLLDEAGWTVSEGQMYGVTKK